MDARFYKTNMARMGRTHVPVSWSGTSTFHFMEWLIGYQIFMLCLFLTLCTSHDIDCISSALLF